MRSDIKSHFEGVDSLLLSPEKPPAVGFSSGLNAVMNMDLEDLGVVEPR